MSVSLNVQNVLRNTALTFGIATAAAVVTVSVNKAFHSWFGTRQSIKSGPSVLISEAAITLGGAVTYSLASRTTLVSFPLDFIFVKYHCLHILFGAYLGVSGALICSKETLNGALGYGALAALLGLSTNAAGSHYSLYAAGAVGVAAGLQI